MNLLLNDPAFLSVAATVSGGGGYDADAQAYITAVETADAAAGSPGGLETAVKDAINAFVVGCKADGIRNAIKASCILSGARTLAGALVPLAGAAPTPFAFASADYNRKTGLKGNGSNKYLNSNRASNEDTRNNIHLVTYSSTASTLTASLDAGVNPDSGGGGDTLLMNRPGAVLFRCQTETSSPTLATNPTAGLTGVSRSSSAGYIARFGGQDYSVPQVSASNLSSLPYFLFAQNNNGAASFADARLAFYSIGESLDLALLDARVTTLINAFAAAIP